MTFCHFDIFTRQVYKPIVIEVIMGALIDGKNDKSGEDEAYGKHRA